MELSHGASALLYDEFVCKAKLDVDPSAAVGGIDNLGTAIGRTTKRMREIIDRSGYLYLALKRIVTYTAIFTFFGTLVRMFKEIIDLETAMAEVSTLVDMRNKQAAESFQNVSASILQLSPYLGSSIQLTKGLYEIMSAGVNQPEEALKLLVTAAKYAKAGLTDLATASSSLTAVMKAYGYSADEMRGKSDMLFASVMEGKYHTAELNDAIGKVLPTAAAMGVQVDEVSAALAVLTQRGLDVNEAATSLNRILLAFLSPIDKAKKEFTKLGWEWGRNAFQSGGLEGALRRLVNASAQYGDLLPKIFRRQRALRGAFVLAGEGYQDYGRLLDKIRSATEDGGEVQRAYGKIITTTGEELKAMWASLVQGMNDMWTSTIQYGDTLRWIIQIFKDFLRVLMESLPAITMTGAVLYKLLIGYRKLTVAYGVVRFGLNATSKMLRNNINIWKESGGRVDAVTMAIQRQAASQRLMLGIVGGAIIAYMAIKTALKEWSRQSDVAMNTMIKVASAQMKLKRTVDLYAAAMRDLGMEIGNYRKDLLQLARQEVVELGRSFGSAKAMYYEFTQTMKKKEGYQAMSEYRNEIWEVSRAIASGEKDLSAYDGILVKLARDYNYVNKAQKEFVETARLIPEIAWQMREAQYAVGRAQRDWSKVLEVRTMHPRNIAKAYGMDVLQDMLKLMQEVIDVAPESVKGMALDDYFRRVGSNLLDAKEYAKDFIKELERAIKAKPGVDFAEMVDQLRRLYEERTKKIIPEPQMLEATTEALLEQYKVWQKGLGDTDAMREAFAKEFKSDLETLILNIDRIGNASDRAFIKMLIPFLDKSDDKMKQFIEKANEMNSQFGSKMVDTLSDTQQIQNRLWDVAEENIYERAKKEYDLKLLWLQKWVDAQKKAQLDSKTLWIMYAQFVLAMWTMLGQARELSAKESIDKELEDQKKVIDATAVNNFDKFLQYQNLYRQIDGLIEKYKLTDVKAQNALKERWAETLGSVETLSKSFYKRLARIFGTLFENVFSDIGNMKDAFKTFSKDMVRMFGESIGELMTAMAFGSAKFKDVVKAMKDIWSSFIEAMGQMFVVFWIQGVVYWLTHVLKLVKDETNDAMNRAEERLDAITDKAAKAIKVLDAAALAAEISIPGGKVKIETPFTALVRWMEAAEESLEKYGYVVQHIVGGLMDAWDEFISYIEKYGLEGSAAVIGLIKQLREMGIEIKALQDYTADWLETGVEGLTAMLKHARNNADELVRLGNITVAFFDSMIANGMDFLDVLLAMEDPLEELRKRFRNLEGAGSEAVDELLAIATVARKYRTLFEGIVGARDALNSLGNTGFLTADIFADLSAQALSYFQQLLDAGLTQEQALRVIAPLLSRLAYYAEQYGFVIDANTQSLIDQADALGLISREGESVTEILITGFNNIVEAIERLIGVLGGDLLPVLGKVGGALGDIYTPPVPLPEKKIHKAVAGEGVVPDEGRLLAVITIDGRQVYRALVPYLREGAEAGTVEQPGEGVF